MKALLIMLATIGATTAPVFAQTRILPSLFAQQYCSLRGLGIGNDEAINTAVKNSSVAGRSTTIVFKGKEMGSDVIAGVDAIIDRCPELMKP